MFPNLLKGQLNRAKKFLAKTFAAIFIEQRGVTDFKFSSRFKANVH
jgi:hypothetical protein